MYGFSSYATSQANLASTINAMIREGVKIYRMSFTPPYSTGRPYNQSYIQYFLDNTPSDFILIADLDHFYPPDNPNSDQWRANYAQVEAYILNVCADFPNNPRVFIELCNEYNRNITGTNSDGSPCPFQPLIDAIRYAGFTNPIVQNKMWQDWSQITALHDPLNNFYTGRHNYFDSKVLADAEAEQQVALDLGLRLINTEGGATAGATQTTDKVAILNQYLSWCANKGISLCTWMYEDTQYLTDYKAKGLIFPANNQITMPYRNPLTALDNLSIINGNWNVN